ncbi:protein adenylyltransferase SelO [Gilvimarinus algae]|uniref:Protein nucleotidyltransferase YdiU n=1 Tax=Gilvimarinus algae TaxID=3058037 RepID=A0ABT8TGP5_9GAMM|nr:protein adenylyltransferase SelO family protein [Gilvimarinus sp. SDUM040014]MDO3383264.1 protein adenylyltransferase SelO family protein [Gilvimarinus sp. SDUM040014]
MSKQNRENTSQPVASLEALAGLADYSLLDTLKRDPDATVDGEDYRPRQVFSGHYVPVKPTPIAEPEYVAHSEALFRELNFDDCLAHTAGFRRLFSGDMSGVPAPMRKLGWATGYALSIYGTEYTQQCPFQTGNGYGDGRAVSVLEAVINGQRWEMQLKGGGRTPYCRGADGRAVLRSSVREFLAQEHMHALGVPTSRSLCLFVSKTESVQRPWYSEGSSNADPDTLVSEPVAISTRVAPSFLRVGQLELFARRAREQAHANSMDELEKIVLHLIGRDYPSDIHPDLSMADKLVALTAAFRERLTALIANWLRVGYCQGNFNSDNCAGGGYTLDYGPFGFCERFDPYFQPWTGGGQHFSFFNQPAAAEQNFQMLCSALRPLLLSHPEQLQAFDQLKSGFAAVMQQKLESMFAAKLGLQTHNAELLNELLALMMKTPVDYTMFFRELAHIPESIQPLQKSFYQEPTATLMQQWSSWLEKWQSQLADGDTAELSQKMLQINPKYTWREWLVVPAYERAKQGDYTLVRELQAVLTRPYDEQSPQVEEKYYRVRPQEFFHAGGVSHYSCSS